MEKITLSELKERYTYNPTTGVFTLNYYFRGMQPGTTAGSYNSHGYLEVSINKKRELIHRLAFLWMTGDYPKEPYQVDHINGNRSDNSWSNLRLATKEENTRNRKVLSNHSTGVKGVTKRSDRNKFRAGIKEGNYFKHLGDFDTIEEATIVVKNYRENLHGDFANHG